MVLQLNKKNELPSSFPTTFPVTCHTDQVEAGSTFVAIKGFTSDGLSFIPLALEKGATRIVIAENAILSPEWVDLIASHNAYVIRVPNTRKALAQLSAQAAGYPSEKLTIIGITGTKGKTTTSFLTRHMLIKAGYRVALLSSAGNFIDTEQFPAPLTTAQPDYIHQFLKLCVERKITHVVMEVAAQAMTLHGVEGIIFNGIIFTNFGLEHLEFYDTLDAYFAAKCQLLNQRSENAFIYLNGDDEQCAPLINQYKNSISFGQRHNAHSQFTLLDKHPIRLVLTYNKKKIELRCPSLSGLFNAYNIVASVLLLLDLGVSCQAITENLLTFTGTPGRFEKYTLSNGAIGIIDYAHNPSSYKAILSELRLLTNHLVVVFGAGGNRDASRRPLMGMLAAQYADKIVITTDNPRFEDPQKIIDDIYTGIPIAAHAKVEIELDREQAIKKAFSYTMPKSIIAILGKGPDQYQEIGSHKTIFNEVDIVRAL